MFTATATATVHLDLRDPSQVEFVEIGGRYFVPLADDCHRCDCGGTVATPFGPSVDRWPTLERIGGQS